jgi:hypothetical protein
MSYHRLPEINSAIIRLLDALCTWERNTGNGSKLILVHDTKADGPNLFAMDGKPIDHSAFELCMDLDLIKNHIMPDWKKREEEIKNGG